MKPLFRSIAFVLGLTAISAAPLHAQAAHTKDIVDTAVSAGSFKTLAAALTAAGLVDTLKGEGPFTVFAPTDEAFAKLPAGTVENLLKPENKAKLVTILTYHVVAGEIPLAKAIGSGQGTTLEGSKVDIRFENGRVKIGQSNLVNADIKTTNGVIHVIDSVLLPSAAETPTQKAAKVIELAIKRGVPLFNEGETDSCAAIYEVTCEALVLMEGVSGNDRLHIARTLESARAEKSTREKAWILRDGLNDVLGSLTMRMIDSKNANR
jgi:uncharacterized surface protein with fasciclin (FAS1) repeats